jgi:hypothetical protein
MKQSKRYIYVYIYINFISGFKITEIDLNIPRIKHFKML